MSEIICTRCQAVDYVRNGIVRGCNAIIAASVPATSRRRNRVANRRR